MIRSGLLCKEPAGHQGVRRKAGFEAQQIRMIQAATRRTVGSDPRGPRKGGGAAHLKRGRGDRAPEYHFSKVCGVAAGFGLFPKVAAKSSLGSWASRHKYASHKGCPSLSSGEGSAWKQVRGAPVAAKAAFQRIKPAINSLNIS